MSLVPFTAAAPAAAHAAAGWSRARVAPAPDEHAFAQALAVAQQDPAAPREPRLSMSTPSPGLDEDDGDSGAFDGSGMSVAVAPDEPPTLSAAATPWLLLALEHVPLASHTVDGETSSDAAGLAASASESVGGDGPAAVAAGGAAMPVGPRGEWMPATPDAAAVERAARDTGQLPQPIGESAAQAQGLPGATHVRDAGGRLAVPAPPAAGAAIDGPEDSTPVLSGDLVGTSDADAPLPRTGAPALERSALEQALVPQGAGRPAGTPVVGAEAPVATEHGDASGVADLLVPSESGRPDGHVADVRGQPGLVAAGAGERAGHETEVPAPVTTAPPAPLAMAAERAPAATPTPPLTPAAGEHVAAQIVSSLRMQWKDGLGEARIHLRPDALGTVTVALRVEQGAVTAVVRADSPQVQDWVLQHQQTLRQQLEAAGLRLDELTVDSESRRQQGSRHDEPADQRHPRRHRQGQEGPTFELLA